MTAAPFWIVVLTLAAPGESSDGLVDFDTEVVPILSRAGCNAAACHGAAAGRGGFALSLFGADPARDLDAIVHELEGRRVNLSKPADSLLIAKPSGYLDHGGGLRLEPGGPEAELLTRWISQGARRLRLRQLVRLSVQGGPLLFERVPAEADLRVLAEFDDGRRRDVTARTIITPADPAAVEAREDGRLTLRRAGEHVVLLRYLSAVRTVVLSAPLGDQPVAATDADMRGPIDAFIMRRLERLRLPPSPPADDRTLLRRATLALTGRLPTAGELEAFERDEQPRRYERAVDRLLASDRFTDYWTFRLGRLLRVRSASSDPEAVAAFSAWLREQVAANRPWRETARLLVSAEGDSHAKGPAAFYRFAGGPREQAEYVSEVLLGIRLRCANCHDHPLDRWTQDDYHGLAAIFAGIQRGRVVRQVPRAEVIHPRTGNSARPRIPGERYLDEPVPDSAATARSHLADWLASDDNPYFARALVNRLWKAMMGRGLVEPVDDLRATNPATHPELLEHLTADFIQHDYDIRHTLRRIAHSAAFRRSSRPRPGNAADDRYYSRFVERPLPAEVLLDALADVTGVPREYPGQPPGTRAIELLDLSTPAPTLDVLGRCEAGQACEVDGAAGGLTAHLQRINGPLINERLAAPSSRLRTWLDRGDANRKIIEQAYRLALSRPPSRREAEFWQRQWEPAEDAAERQRRLEDFLWSLLNCREFVTNH